MDTNNVTIATEETIAAGRVSLGSVSPVSAPVAMETNSHVAGSDDSCSDIDEHSLLQHEERQSNPDPAVDYGIQPSIVYYVFYLLGMGTLLPWNFFITADAYWNYKFRNVSEAADVNVTDSTPLQRNFYGYLSVASMLPNTTFLVLMAIVSHRVRLHLSLVVSLSLVILLFVANTILVPVDSDHWQTLFLAITLLSVAAMNACSAVFQSGLFGLAARLPGSVVSAVMSGQALGAVFACLARIVSVATSSSTPSGSSSSTPSTGVYGDSVQSALVYFLLADITLLISLVAYLYVCSLDFYKVHTSSSSSALSAHREQCADSAYLDNNSAVAVRVTDSPTTNKASCQVRSRGGRVSRSPVVNKSQPTAKIWPVLCKIKLYAVSVCLVFLVTLSVFPAIANKVVPLSAVDTVWAQRYFIPVCCFLLFNVGDLVGRIIASYTDWPTVRPGATLFLMSVSRLALPPLLMLCNVQHQHLPTVFASDIYYAAIVAVLGLSNGYVASLCMMRAPGSVAPHERNVASTLMVAFLGIGLCAGAFLSNLLIQLL